MSIYHKYTEGRVDLMQPYIWNYFHQKVYHLIKWLYRCIVTKTENQSSYCNPLTLGILTTLHYTNNNLWDRKNIWAVHFKLAQQFFKR